MKFDQPIPVTTLAIDYGCRVVGNSNTLAQGINVIHSVEDGDITFVDHPKYYNKVMASAATVILIDQPIEVPTQKCLLVCSEPFSIYNRIIQERRPAIYNQDNIHPTAQIHETATLEPGVVIGAHCIIGANTIIQANGYIGSYTSIGSNVIIEPCSIIGSDAFYYKKDDQLGYIKWVSGGITIIEDDVEVGAGSTINKGVSSRTVIGTGTKIDCQVHIGHGCRIGAHCLIAAQCGIGGKTKIGDHVTLFGQVGIAQNLVIGDRAVILAKSGVSKNLAGDKVYFGYPAEEATRQNRMLASLRQLPEWLRKSR